MAAFFEALEITRQEHEAGNILGYMVSGTPGYRVITAECEQGTYVAFAECNEPYDPAQDF